MNRDILVRKTPEPTIILTIMDDTIVRIFKSSWDNVYNVITEDAHRSKDCGHKFMQKYEVEELYNIDLDRYIGE
jgi:hypothetical protein